MPLEQRLQLITVRITRAEFLSLPLVAQRRILDEIAAKRKRARKRERERRKPVVYGLCKSPNKPCPAVIWHGPGHQSSTNCQLIGKHQVHMAVYGSMEQTARWQGAKAFSGCFDEPPRKET